MEGSGRRPERGYALKSWGLTEGWQVALLDVDLCGPSIPRVLGLEDKEVNPLPIAMTHVLLLVTAARELRDQTAMNCSAPFSSLSRRAP